MWYEYNPAFALLDREAKPTETHVDGIVYGIKSDVDVLLVNLIGYSNQEFLNRGDAKVFEFPQNTNTRTLYRGDRILAELHKDKDNLLTKPTVIHDYFH